MSRSGEEFQLRDFADMATRARQAGSADFADREIVKIRKVRQNLASATADSYQDS